MLFESKLKKNKLLEIEGEARAPVLHSWRRESTVTSDEVARCFVVCLPLQLITSVSAPSYSDPSMVDKQPRKSFSQEGFFSLSAFIAVEEEQFNWLIIALARRARGNLHGNGLLTPVPSAAAAAAAGGWLRVEAVETDASRENVANLKRQDCWRSSDRPPPSVSSSVAIAQTPQVESCRVVSRINEPRLLCSASASLSLSLFLSVSRFGEKGNIKCQPQTWSQDFQPRLTRACEMRG